MSLAAQLGIEQKGEHRQDGKIDDREGNPRPGIAHGKPTKENRQCAESCIEANAEQRQTRGIRHPPDHRGREEHELQRGSGYAHRQNRPAIVNALLGGVVSETSPPMPRGQSLQRRSQCRCFSRVPPGFPWAPFFGVDDVPANHFGLLSTSLYNNRGQRRRISKAINCVFAR